MNTQVDISQQQQIEKVEQRVAPKAYHSPHLIEYGSIQQLTKAIGNMGAVDGGATAGMMMTSV